MCYANRKGMGGQANYRAGIILRIYPNVCFSLCSMQHVIKPLEKRVLQKLIDIAVMVQGKRINDTTISCKMGEESEG